MQDFDNQLIYVIMSKKRKVVNISGKMPRRLKQIVSKYENIEVIRKKRGFMICNGEHSFFLDMGSVVTPDQWDQVAFEIKKLSKK